LVETESLKIGGRTDFGAAKIGSIATWTKKSSAKAELFKPLSIHGKSWSASSSGDRLAIRAG
jgi:hypothetical protein